jgi:DNA-binding transcriptional regulator of glucitol operon
MNEALMLLAAVVAGWLVQMYLTLRQSTAFNKRVVELRSQGTVVVGVAGRRYRGGRAYVALALDDHRVVRDALTLQGWTTFARGNPLPALVGVRASKLAGPRDVPGLTPQQRDAARMAVVSLKEAAATT